jgi:hypothetical protein
LEVGFENFVKADLNSNWKGQNIFIDIHNAIDLEDILLSGS